MDNNASSKGVLLVSVVAFCAVVAAVTYLLLRPVSIEISSREIAAGTADLLVDLRAPTKVINSLKCDDFGECSSVQTGGTPELTWRILAFAALSKGENGAAYKQALKEEIKALAAPDRVLPVRAGLWQLYRAYRLSGEVELLKSFVKGAENLTFQMKTGYIDKELVRHDPMLNAASLLQLIYLYEVLSDSTLAPVVSSTPGVVSFKDPAQLLAILKSQIDRLRKLLITQVRGGANIVPGEGFGSYHCWLALPEYHYGRVFKDATATEGVTHFLGRMQFSTRPASEYRFLSLQLTLPCAELLADMVGSDPGKRGDFLGVIEKGVLPYYDGAKRPICEGDNSFISFNVETGGDQCPRNTKSVPSMAWVASLLAQIDASFKLSLN